MTDEGSITDLTGRRSQGDIDRDAYWAAMQRHHRTLAEYPGLLSRAGIDRLEINADGIVLWRADGIGWWWDPDQVRSPLSVLVNDGDYEPAEWRALRALASVSPRIVDVGANIGWYVARMANLPGVDTVDAFEPVPSTYRALVRNVQLNALDERVTTHPFGLSDRDASVTFFVPMATGNVAASERRLFDTEHQQEISVELRRLDGLEPPLERVGLIKCDVEGGEFGFLRGAEGILIENRPYVMLEMLRKWAAQFGYHPNDIVIWMRSRDFACFSLEAQIHSVEEVDETTTATNFLFVHRTRLDEFRRVMSVEFDVSYD